MPLRAAEAQMRLAGLTCPGTSFMRIALVASLLMLLPGPASSQTIAIRLYAAGSLRVALTEVARDFEAHGGGRYKVEPTFGASGLLREKIEAGELAHVFASADTGHPSKLAEQGRTVAPTTIFARNELCAIVRSGIEASPKSLLDVLLDPKVRVGISTPKADPSGDYAIAVFNKAEALRTGSKAVLEAKAVQLTGAPSSRKAPEGRNLYGWLMDSGQADVFLTYCTNAALAKAEAPTLAIVTIPKEIGVGASYGLVVMKGAPSAASALADHIRSARGQAILARHGFGAGD
jgi:molybdenum ABC transporter molybdate-binding protein